MAQTDRPLSPHLQIYSPQLTSVASVFHRATGFALAAGTLFFAWWLVAAASGPVAYATFTNFCNSGLGLILLLGWSVSFYYHLANGIRHLFWDAGFLFKLRNAYAAGYFVFLFTGAMSGITWYCVYMF